MFLVNTFSQKFARSIQKGQIDINLGKKLNLLVVITL
jgi:hypothetical protein